MTDEILKFLDNREAFLTLKYKGRDEKTHQLGKPYLDTVEALRVAVKELNELSYLGFNSPSDARISCAHIEKIAHKSLTEIASILGVKGGEK